MGFFEADTGEKPVAGLKRSVSPFSFLPMTLFSLHSFGFRREMGPIIGVIPVQTSLRIHGVGCAFYPVALQFIYSYPNWCKKEHDL